jgi:hypothetical protein
MPGLRAGHFPFMHRIKVNISESDRADFEYFLRKEGFKDFRLTARICLTAERGSDVSKLSVIFEHEQDATYFKLKDLEFVYNQNKPYYVNLDTEFEEEFMRKYGED